MTSDLLSSSASFEEILEDYPYIDRENISTAIEYAALDLGACLYETINTCQGQEPL